MCASPQHSHLAWQAAAAAEFKERSEAMARQRLDEARARVEELSKAMHDATHGKPASTHEGGADGALHEAVKLPASGGAGDGGGSGGAGGGGAGSGSAAEARRRKRQAATKKRQREAQRRARRTLAAEAQK